MRSARQAHAFSFDLNCGKSGVKIVLNSKISLPYQMLNGDCEVYFRARLQSNGRETTGDGSAVAR